MADTYGSSSLGYQALSSATSLIASHGSAVEAVRFVLGGGTFTLSGQEASDVLFALQLHALVEVADLIGPLVPHMGEQS